MLLFDATHTSHTAAQTGIQRVCRSLFEELLAKSGAAPVCYDPHLIGWRPLTPNEFGVLSDQGGGSGKSRSAKWTLSQKISGATARWRGRKPTLPDNTGLICPEFFSAKVAAHLPEIFVAASGPRVAIFYDAIPLKFPELTPPGTVARMPAYLRELLQFDGIAAISTDSAASLRDYWQWLGVHDGPPVEAIPLAVDPLSPTVAVDSSVRRTRSLPRILSVGTLEGRKNHLALLQAAAALWDSGAKFELQLLGLARPDTAKPALDLIAALQRAGRPLLYGGSVTDENLHAAYRECSFTVYPSLIEGFGLPVLESLQHGRPCICSGRGALAESAMGGGCIALNSVDATSLTTAMRSLLENPSELSALAAAVRNRKLQTWNGYADAVLTWMKTLSRRA
jgi:glycosyltransferase involved in cell wall biosynthesis